MSPIKTLSRSSLAAVLALAACQPGDPTGPTPPTPVAAVVVTAPSPTLLVGAQMTLAATPRAADGAPLERAITWTSDDEGQAIVSTTGVVTGIEPGPVTIRATSGGKEGVVALTIMEVEAPPPPPVASVRLNVEGEVRLDWDGHAQLHAVAFDRLGNPLSDRAIIWQSSNPAVVTVSGAGRIEAVTPGLAVVSARSEGIEATVGVRVLEAPVVEVVIELGVSGLETGETVFAGARLRTASGQVTYGPVTWSSNATSVATVTTTGLPLGAIHAVAPGTATITARTGQLSASVTLRVTPPPTHDLIYARNVGTEMEIFTLGLAAAGVPVRINTGNVSYDPSPSPDGTQVAFAVSQFDLLGRRQDDLYLVNRNGLNLRWLTRTTGREDSPAWSPDGTRILFRGTDESGVADLWTINVDGTGLINLTDRLPEEVEDVRHPAWSPDGSRIAFIGVRNGRHNVWIMAADGSTAAPLTTDAGFDTSPTWAPDGSRIAFSRYNAAEPANGWDVMIIPAAGGAPTRLSLPGDQQVPAWSPDGEYIAVSGSVVAGQGTPQLFTLRPDGSGLRLRTTNPAWGGGLTPAWIARP